MGIILNIDVTTRKGINYEVQTIRIPLYLKLLNFFDRHYNYKLLINRIVKDVNGDQEIVMRLFKWTFENIRKVPEGFPIIDDHVWHIIIRGYGANDQSSDVFATLSNYAGVDAFFTWVYTKDRTRRIPLSFVRIEGRWGVFDPYNGIYFKNNKNMLAEINDIKKGNWKLRHISGSIVNDKFDYQKYFDNLPNIENVVLKRSQIQSPWKRFLFELKK